MILDEMEREAEQSASGSTAVPPELLEMRREVKVKQKDLMNLRSAYWGTGKASTSVDKQKSI